jgi:adenylate cyclase
MGLALVTNVVAVSGLYLRARADLFDQINATALSIASTLAGQVDADAHDKIATSADEGGPEYKRLVSLFRAARDSNRRDDVYVKYVYSFRRAEGGKGFEYVIDAEEKGQSRSGIGDPYIFEQMDKYPPDFEKPQVLPVLVKDQYGTWLSATSPIFDEAGRSVGAVGVDIRATDVEHDLRGILIGGGVSLAVSLVLAAVLAFYMSGRVTRRLAKVADAARAVGSGDLAISLDTTGSDEFAQVSQAMNQMVEGLRQRDNLKQTLVRYVSKEVADEILASGELPHLEAARRKVTVVFADIRGFTALSEGTEPEQVVLALNSYFDRMIDAVFRNKGYLNKFIGDGLMAVFGAPVEDPHQEQHAVQAALDMYAEVEKLQDSFRTLGAQGLRVAIGVNTGMAVVGNIGSEQKMEYTAIGDAVNTASRLEAAAKSGDLPIVVSEYTYVAVRNLFEFERIGEVELKGKADKVAAYTVRAKD